MLAIRGHIYQWSLVVSSRKYGIFEEPDCADKHSWKYHHPKFVPTKFVSVQLVPQHLHRAYRQEGSSRYWQKYRLHEVTKGGYGPTESDCHSIQQSLTDNQTVSYLFLNVFVAVVDAHRQSICPLVEGNCQGDAEETTNWILNTYGYSLENSVEVHC